MNEKLALFMISLLDERSARGRFASMIHSPTLSYEAPMRWEGVPRKEDDILIDEALGGNSNAFGQLVLKYRQRLLNAMTHHVGNATEAEDVVQEAFTNAFLKLDTFQHTSAFYSWLYRIACNTAVSRTRKKKVTTSIDHTSDQTGDEPTDPGEPPDAHLIQEENRKLVWSALKTLSDERRHILFLREFENYEYEKIAEILGICTGTVRSRLNAARTELRRALEEMTSQN